MMEREKAVRLSKNIAASCLVLAIIGFIIAGFLVHPVVGILIISAALIGAAKLFAKVAEEGKK
jgi:Na+/H+ antiporter NhaD/arsenite permease-like protein